MRLSIVLFLAAIIAGCATPQQCQLASIPPNPESDCIEALASRVEFAAIRSKIYLARAKNQPFAMMTNTDRPTAEEKKAITAWIGARQECFDNASSWAQQYLPSQLIVIGNRVMSSFLALTADLCNGKITYGDYARGRARIYAAAQRDCLAVIRRVHGELIY